MSRSRAGILPPSPDTVKRTGRSGDCRPSSARRSSGRTISMNVTSSPGSRDSDSCTSAIVRIRRTESGDGRLRLGVRQPAGLQAQQRRDRLQVVLHPVVDLADRGVLAQQQPVALAQLGDVAHQQQPAADRRLRRRRRRQDRHAPAQQRDVVALLELLDHRHPVARRPGAPGRRGSRARRAASRPRLAWMPTRCSAELAFGRHVADAAVAVEPHHAVADARRGARIADPSLERERRRPRSSARTARTDRVVPFQLARMAPSTLDPLLPQHGDVATVAVAQEWRAFARWSDLRRRR